MFINVNKNFNPKSSYIMILSHFFLFPKSGHVDRKRILDIMSSFYDNAIEAVRSSLQNPRKCKF